MPGGAWLLTAAGVQPMTCASVQVRKGAWGLPRVVRALNPLSSSSLLPKLWEGLWPTLPAWRICGGHPEAPLPFYRFGGRGGSSLFLSPFHLLNARIINSLSPAVRTHCGNLGSLEVCMKQALGGTRSHYQSNSEAALLLSVSLRVAIFRREKDTQKLFFHGGQVRSSAREINYSVFQRVTSRLSC